jgi:hypothetical protein
MTRFSEFNKIKKKMNGSELLCKAFYDSWGTKIEIKKNFVYLKKDVEEIFNKLRILFDEKDRELYVLKKEKDEIESENYKLKYELKKWIKKSKLKK